MFGFFLVLWSVEESGKSKLASEKQYMLLSLAVCSSQLGSLWWCSGYLISLARNFKSKKTFENFCEWLLMNADSAGNYSLSHSSHAEVHTAGIRIGSSWLIFFASICETLWHILNFSIKSNLWNLTFMGHFSVGKVSTCIIVFRLFNIFLCNFIFI